MAHGDGADTNCHGLMQFAGEGLDPDNISSLLDLKPFSSKKRGEPLGPPRPGRPTPLARKGAISYSTHTLRSNDINEHFRYLLQAISPVVNEVKSLVGEGQLSWRIICFFDKPPPNLRVVLDPSIANSVDGLGIELFMDDPNTITVEEEP
jgi:hypothetical protein